MKIKLNGNSRELRNVDEVSTDRVISEGFDDRHKLIGCSQLVDMLSTQKVVGKLDNFILRKKKDFKKAYSHIKDAKKNLLISFSLKTNSKE